MSDRYRKFTQTALDSVRAVGDSFSAPDDDWMPVALIDSRVHGFVPVALQFSDKDPLVSGLQKLLRQTAAERCALVMSAWSAIVGPEWDGLPAAQIADRFEVVAVTIIDRERVEGYSARIERREDAPPILGSWDSLLPEHGTVTGRFVEPLQTAMR